jgi:hypothetical protein
MPKSTKLLVNLDSASNIWVIDVEIIDNSPLIFIIVVIKNNIIARDMILLLLILKSLFDK